MEDKFETLGQLIDELDTLTYSLQIPMDNTLHVEMLRDILPDKVGKLKKTFIKITGENPWE